ncbi:MAG: UDP-glucose 4-epimerase [Acidimicrobiaceae bacterium]|jgi:UDP-glucose 4-epimerase
MTAVAVTGAAGYVGGRLIEHLRDSGADVRALVRRERSWLDVAQIEVDLVTSPSAAVADALDGIDVVVHLAGRSEVDAAQDPEGVLTDTVLGSQRLAAAASVARVRRVVYASTVHVYGARMQPGVVLDEELRPEPRHPYAIARLTSEHVLRSAGEQGDFSVAILRLTNGVGAPADPEVERWTLVANDLCRQAVTTGQMTLDTSGVQWRDFIALADACTAIAASCTDEVPTGTYNLGSGCPTRVLDLATLVQGSVERLTGVKPTLEAPNPPADPPKPYRVDVSRLQARGIIATTSLTDAIDETVRFCADRMVHR